MHCDRLASVCILSYAKCSIRVKRERKNAYKQDQREKLKLYNMCQKLMEKFDPVLFMEGLLEHVGVSRQIIDGALYGDEAGKLALIIVATTSRTRMSQLLVLPILGFLKLVAA